MSSFTFGRDGFWPIHLDLGVCVMVGPKGGAQTQKGVAPKGGDLKGGAPKGGEGGPKISRFFHSPAHFRSFCLSVDVFSWNVGGV